MGIPVLILGESGAGKSASLRNFDSKEIGIFNVASKPLPFRKKMKVINGARYADIFKEMQAPIFPTYAIDDSQYLMAFESFDRAKETGYGKFTDMALNFYNLIQCVRNAPPNCIVYFLHHTEMTDTGRVKAKTIGKMLDNQLTVEGLFSIVLLCAAGKDKHSFITVSDGCSPAKAPMEMFEPEIDNDLKFVDITIREYYGLKAKEESKNGETE